MDGAGSSSLSGIPRKRKTQPTGASEEESGKRAKTSASTKKKTRQPRTKKVPEKPALHRSAESMTHSQPVTNTRLEEAFSGLTEERLKEIVSKEASLCIKNNDTLAKAVSHLNGNFKQFKNFSCDGAMLFDYMERHQILDTQAYHHLIPLEVAILKAACQPDILDQFFLAWWESGRNFQKVYSFAKGSLPNLKTSPGEEWHPVDILNNSPSLKQRLEALDDTSLTALYSAHRQKKINETGRLLLCAHTQVKALELYLTGKLETGNSLNAIAATLRKAKAPADLCNGSDWGVLMLFRWLEPRLEPESELYGLLVDELPITELSRSGPVADNYDYALACIIKNWVKKNGALSNFIQHISTKGVLLPEWANSWKSQTIGHLITSHFDIRGFFPNSLALLTADYNSTVSKTRREQLGTELLVRACAREPGAVKAYINCRLFMGEEHRAADEEGLREDSRKTDCEQIALALNNQGIFCPLNPGGRWIGELVDSFVS
ncbi:hypothetical protein [Endozoicomonas numazuensis]|nr:hypothetical protein [Endozoicomonas numazuensis]